MPPHYWVPEIWEILSFSFYGIPLGIVAILIAFFILSANTKKTMSVNKEKSTNQKVLEGVALAALAHKLIKKPVLTFENSESKVIDEKICWDLNWDIKFSYINNGVKTTTTQNITRGTRSSTVAEGFKVDWVDISLDDLPEPCRKVACSALGAEM